MRGSWDELPSLTPLSLPTRLRRAGPFPLPGGAREVRR
ncbi:hypothetical protein SPHINGO391_350292 [Sphingomonas aurantiaca]|uniref:Uncharacterized protein n=1 Tax=Sphingomonas aurantiaca TaxID=185949 RepID=A0A5E7Y4Q3_9SPHN|nr:hypothetical protein SPHINGO391_350292 [Sphingomonas aurantiaca]